MSTCSVYNLIMQMTKNANNSVIKRWINCSVRLAPKKKPASQYAKALKTSATRWNEKVSTGKQCAQISQDLVLRHNPVSNTKRNKMASNGQMSELKKRRMSKRKR